MGGLSRRFARGGRLRTSLSALLSAAAFAGCGESAALRRAAVSGSVFTGGKALESGTIRFVPVDGTIGPAATASVTDGFYAFSAEDGPVVGRHRVEIVTLAHLGFDPGDQEAAERAMAAAKGKLPPNPIAAAYSGPRSPLTADVPPEGLAACDFVLDSKGRAAASP